MRTKELKQLIIQTVENSEHNAFFRSDFTHLGGSYDLLGKALKELCQEGLLVKVSHGVYGKTEICQVKGFEGKRILSEGITALAPEALTRLGYQIVPTQATRDYNDRKSTQVPTGRNIGIKGKQTKRRFAYKGVSITYEYVK